MPPASLPSPGDVVCRTLALYVNEGAAINAGHYPAPQDVVHRGLYLYVNEGTYGNPSGGEPLDQDDVLARILYLYVNEGVLQAPDDVALRALYDYVAYTNDEPFPWIERLVPNEQLRLGQVDIHGDGFGDTQAAEGGQVKLNATPMGVVSWSARSPNLWPANGDGSGDPPPLTEKAITVTVPEEGESGLVTVELTV